MIRSTLFCVLVSLCFWAGPAHAQSPRVNNATAAPPGRRARPQPPAENQAQLRKLRAAIAAAHAALGARPGGRISPANRKRLKAHRAWLRTVTARLSQLERQLAGARTRPQIAAARSKLAALQRQLLAEARLHKTISNVLTASHQTMMNTIRNLK